MTTQYRVYFFLVRLVIHSFENHKNSVTNAILSDMKYVKKEKLPLYIGVTL